MREKAIEEFKLLLLENIRNVSKVVETAELLGVTNELWYMDYEVAISLLVTKDHNKIAIAL